jgi:hypothetical protein
MSQKRTHTVLYSHDNINPFCEGPAVNFSEPYDSRKVFVLLNSHTKESQGRGTGFSAMHFTRNMNCINTGS